MDKPKQVKNLHRLPGKPLEGDKLSRDEEPRGTANGQQELPVRIYPLISPALPNYLKRRRRRKRRGGDGHE